MNFTSDKRVCKASCFIASAGWKSCFRSKGEITYLNCFSSHLISGMFVVFNEE